MKQLQRAKNWNVSGPDRLQGYWIQTFASYHETYYAVMQLQLCLEMIQILDWLTTGNTVLVMKDRRKGNDVINFRPITCLPVMSKIFTGILCDELYKHLKSCQMNKRGPEKN